MPNEIVCRQIITAKRCGKVCDRCINYFFVTFLISSLLQGNEIFKSVCHRTLDISVAITTVVMVKMNVF